MSKIKEKDYPKAVSFESTKIILEQMKNNLCKIIMDDGSKGTGFFCKINNNKLPVLITNNHVINDLNKNVTINYDNKYIDIILKERIKYTNEEYDITIIEINEKDEIKNFLEIDEEIMKEGANKSYINESIYTLQYPKEKLVSYGIIKNIMEDKNYNFLHLCSTKNGSSGSPIINLKNKKVIGIHKETTNKNHNYNIGLFLNYPIKDFIQNEFFLKQLNNKYKLNIKDNKIDILNLKNYNLGNEGLKELIQLNFKNLKELHLNNNNISDIKILKKVKFENLEILGLGGNKISDISNLEKANFKELKKLVLSYNNISDIKALEKVKFEKFEKLDLSRNEIDLTKNNLIISKLKSLLKKLDI